jgi:hypothetical protein
VVAECAEVENRRRDGVEGVTGRSAQLALDLSGTATVPAAGSRVPSMLDRLEGKGEKRWLDMAVVIVILLLWVLLLRYEGFALSGVVGFASIAWYIGGERKNWK